MFSGRLHLLLVLVAFFGFFDSLRAKPTEPDPYLMYDMADDSNEYDEYPDEVESPEGEISSPGPPPVITTASLNITVNEGDTVFLPCDFDDPSGDVTVLWARPSKGIQLYLGKITIAVNKDKYDKFPNQTLVVKNVTAEDEDSYKCSAVGAGYEPPSVTHFLHVNHLHRPVINFFKTIDEQTNILEGTRVVILCNATGSPTPLVSLSKNGHILSNPSPHEATITYTNITYKDAGTYQCLADNHMGNPIHSALQLHVEHPPKIHQEKVTINTAVGYQSRLSCLVSANPKASVSWYKDKQYVNHDQKHSFEIEGNRYTLIINDTKEEDFGVYRCSADNGIGKAHKDFHLYGRPEPPFLRSIERADDEKSPLISWTVVSNSPIIEHALKYRKTKTDTWISSSPKVTNPDGTVYTEKYVIKNLEPGAYEVQIRSKNEYGWSEWSKMKEIVADNEKKPEAQVSGTSTEKQSGAQALTTTVTVLLTTVVPFLVSFLID